MQIREAFVYNNNVDPVNLMKVITKLVTGCNICQCCKYYDGSRTPACPAWKPDRLEYDSLACTEYILKTAKDGPHCIIQSRSSSS